MVYIVDAHQDLAYNMLNFERDYLRSAYDIRKDEAGTDIIDNTGDSVLGWPEFQKGQVAVIFSTLFVAPEQYKFSDAEKVAYRTADEARVFLQKEVDIYHQWEQNHPDAFQLIRKRGDVEKILMPWIDQPAQHPKVTHPIGLVLLLEGAEAIGQIQDLEHWQKMGVRIVGPVWAGTRFCGGTHTSGGFTPEGYELLDFMNQLGLILDVSHMNEKSSLQALDYYPGRIIASHVNASRLVKEDPRERQFSDETIQALLNRDGIMGAVMYNRFIKAGWKHTDGKHEVTLDDLIAHIDHVCQMAGDTQHAGLGSDFDGGFGHDAIPSELDTIADLQKMVPLLQNKGYNEVDIQNIMGANWINALKIGLPES